MEDVREPRHRLWHGTARHERDAERRHRLLGAALELYGTVGYRSVTVQGLCRFARISTRSFYELFPGQQALLEQLYLELNQEIVHALSAPSPASGSEVPARVRILIGAALGPLLADDRKARVLEVEAVGVSDSLEEIRRDTMRRLASAVDDALETLTAAQGSVPAPGGLTGLILVGGLTEALVQRVQTPPAERMSSEQFLDEVTRVVLRISGLGR